MRWRDWAEVDAEKSWIYFGRERRGLRNSPSHVNPGRVRVEKELRRATIANLNATAIANPHQEQRVINMAPATLSRRKRAVCFLATYCEHSLTR